MKFIDISTPKYPNTFTMVDDEDFEQINQFKWYPTPPDSSNNVYVFRSVKIGRFWTTIRMHRDILHLRRNDGKVSDHRNHNGLDNRKENLRICTTAENTRNRRHNQKPTSSKYKGVCWMKSHKSWIAYIKKHGKLMFLGYYKIETDAAKAYNSKALELFGEFAYLNNVHSGFM